MCLGVGVTINEATRSIFWERDWVTVNDQQSKGRNYRNGQKNNVIFDMLVCNKTLEVKQYATLEKKEGENTNLFKGDIATLDEITELFN